MNRPKYCPICGKPIPPFYNVSMTWTTGGATPITSTGTIVLSGMEETYCMGHRLPTTILASHTERLQGYPMPEGEPEKQEVPSSFYKAFAGDGEWE